MCGKEQWHHQDVSTRMHQRSPACLPQTPGTVVLFFKAFLCICCSVYFLGKPCLSQSLSIPFSPGLKALGSLLLLCPSHPRAQELQKDGWVKLFYFKNPHFIWTFSHRAESTVVPSGNFCSRRANSLINPLICDGGNSGPEPAQPSGNSYWNEEF